MAPLADFAHQGSICAWEARVPDRRSRLFSGVANEGGVEIEMRGYDAWMYVACTNGVAAFAHNDSLIIAIGAAFANNETYRGRAAIGVLVHRDSPLNYAAEILTDDRQSLNRAVLHAALKALEIVKAVREQHVGGISIEDKNGGPSWPLTRVVIKTDSAWFVEGITQEIFRWEARG